LGELEVVSGEVGSAGMVISETGSFLIVGDGCGDVTEEVSLGGVGDWMDLRLRGVICMMWVSVLVMMGIWGGFWFVEMGLTDVGWRFVIGI